MLNPPPTSSQSQPEHAHALSQAFLQVLSMLGIGLGGVAAISLDD